MYTQSKNELSMPTSSKLTTLQTERHTQTDTQTDTQTAATDITAPKTTFTLFF